MPTVTAVVSPNNPMDLSQAPFHVPSNTLYVLLTDGPATLELNESDADDAALDIDTAHHIDIMPGERWLFKIEAPERIRVWTKSGRAIVTTTKAVTS